MYHRRNERRNEHHGRKKHAPRKDGRKERRKEDHGRKEHCGRKEERNIYLRGVGRGG